MLARTTLASSAPEAEPASDDLVGLTAELYAFVHSTEKLATIRRRSRAQLDRYRARARELSERFAAARVRFAESRHRFADDAAHRLAEANVRWTEDADRFAEQTAVRLAEANVRWTGDADRFAEKTAVRLAEANVRLTGDADRFAEETTARFERAAADLEHLVRVLGQARPHLPEVRRRWKSLGYSYEGLVAEIRRRRWRIPDGLTLGRLKPRNLNRNLFHVMNGVVAVLVYELVGSRLGTLAIGGSVLAAFVAMDVLRRVSPEMNRRMVEGWFSKIVRPHEAHKVPSATWFLAGLMVGVVALPQHAIELGTLALAFGDPAASLSGKRWGRLKLRGEKSLAGSLGFVGAATLAGLVLLSLVRPDLAFLARLGIAAGVGVAGAVAELFSDRLDDNFTVPLVAGGAAALLLAI